MSTPRNLTKFNSPRTQSPDFWADGFFNQHARKAFRAFASMQMRQMQAHVIRQIASCESPLEAAFYAWWIVLHSVGATSLDLIPQHPVRVGSKSYRLDFSVRPVHGGTFSMLAGTDAAPKVAIELDGHAYHDKTTEQVTTRNKRDRALSADGWTVLHVSYSEFHDDPIGTVTGIAEQVSAVFEQAISGRLLGA